MRAIICYHGIDADGWMCGILATKVCLDAGIEILEYIGCNYDDTTEKKFDTTMKNYLGDDLVVILGDYTFKDETMTKWAKYIWHFDHHASRIETRLPWRDKLALDCNSVYWPKKKGDPLNPRTFISACELMYYYIFKKHALARFGIEVEDDFSNAVINICGRHDVWDLSDYNENIHTGLMEVFSQKWEEYRSNPWKVFREGIKLLDWDNKSFLDNCYDVGKIVNRHEYIVNAHKVHNTTCKVLEVPELGTFYISAINGSVSSKFWDPMIASDKRFTIGISYHLSAYDGRMFIGCRSIHDNQPAKAVWEYIEEHSGLKYLRGSFGGHRSACGGNYAGGGIVRLYSYLQSLPDVENSDQEDTPARGKKD